MSAEGIEQPLVGMMTDRGEVSDSTCFRLAAAICDSQAHMLGARILSCGTSLTPMSLAACHTVDVRRKD